IRGRVQGFQLLVGQGRQVRAHLLRLGLPDPELLPDGADTGYARGGDVVGELARGAELQLGRLGYRREYGRAVRGCGYLRGGYGCRLGGYGHLGRLGGDPRAVHARLGPYLALYLGGYLGRAGLGTGDQAVPRPQERQRTQRRRGRRGRGGGRLAPVVADAAHVERERDAPPGRGQAERQRRVHPRQTPAGEAVALQREREQAEFADEDEQVDQERERVRLPAGEALRHRPPVQAAVGLREPVGGGDQDERAHQGDGGRV